MSSLIPSGPRKNNKVAAPQVLHDTSERWNIKRMRRGRSTKDPIHDRRRKVVGSE